MAIDTLADVRPANESDQAKARQFVGILRGLAIRRRCAVMLLAHPSLSGLRAGTGLSGSTARNNPVRSGLQPSRIRDDGHEPNPVRRVLTAMRTNHDRTAGEIAMTWCCGAFAADPEPTSTDALAAGAKAERVFLELLDTFTDQGRTVSASPSGNCAASVFARHPDADGVKKAAFVSAMNARFSTGIIRLETSGPPSRQRQFVARARGEGDDRCPSNALAAVRPHIPPYILRACAPLKGCAHGRREGPSSSSRPFHPSACREGGNDDRRR